MNTLSSAYDRISPWFWLDIETSGLEPATDEILEIYIAVTDKDLNVWDTLHLVIHHPYNVLLAKASTWCKSHFCSKSHQGNGLFDECNFSNTSHAEAERQLWNFFEYYSSHEVGTGRPAEVEMPFMDKTSDSDGRVLHPRDVSSTKYSTTAPHRSALLAGSTVHFDRQFLMKHFPSLRKFLSHKSIDVTSMLETFKRFRKDLLRDKPKPSGNHRAGEDIHDSINLLRFFKNNLFDKIEVNNGHGHVNRQYQQSHSQYAQNYRQACQESYTHGRQRRDGHYNNISKTYPS